MDELIEARQVGVSDVILVTTSGHSGGRPDRAAVVVDVTSSEPPVLLVRLCDGRLTYHVPERHVHRLRPAA